MSAVEQMETTDPRDVVLDVVRFNHKLDKHPKPARVKLGDLLTAHAIRSDKDGPAWSPARYRPGTKRGKENVEATTALVFDLDHKTPDEERAALAQLNGYAWARYTTFSHRAKGEGDHCARIVLPVDGTIPGEAHERVWRYVNETYLGGASDPATKDASRIHYLPATSPERFDDAEVEFRPGVVLDAASILGDVPPDPPRRRPDVDSEPSTRESIYSEVNEEARVRRYAIAALDREAENVRRAVEGERQVTLNRAAFNLGQLVATGALDRVTVENVLWTAATSCGLPEGEIDATIRHGLDDGAKQRREIPQRRIEQTRGNTSAPPAEVEIVDPAAPLSIARGFMGKRVVDGGNTLVYHQGEFLDWTGTHFRACETVEIERDLYGHLDRCGVVTKEGELVAYNPTRRKVGDVEHALRSVCALTSIADPAWIGDAGPVPPEEVLSCANGLLHIPTRRLIPHTPRFFTRSSVPFAFDAKAPQPREWLSFLDALWPDDPEARDTLQEIAGYLLTADTSQQKAFLLVGPKRSGKGTIGRILTTLLGKENVAAPTLTSLSSNFGLAPLIGRRMALIADARLGNRADQAVIAERLLSLTGEDTQTIDRKHRDQWTGYLPTRFVILTNELPRIADASGALSSRFVILTMARSFYGQEDTGLTARLLPEMPGILGWALEGLDRLRARGHFVLPRSSEAAVEDLNDLGSPVGAFLREECEVAPNRLTPCEDLFRGWSEWCERQGRHAGNQATFGRDLGAAIPGLRKIRPREGDARVWTYQGVGFGSRGW